MISREVNFLMMVVWVTALFLFNRLVLRVA